MASACSQPPAAHTDEDWQAQLEEVLALQSIFAEDFRVTHIPGHGLVSSRNSSTGGSDGGSGDDACPASYQQLEQQLESLLGSAPPASATEGVLTCEAIVHVELPAGQLQLLLDMQEKQQPHSWCLQDNCQVSASCLQDSCCGVAAGACGPNSCCSSDSSSCMPFGPPVSYLPPVCVQLSLPHDYPSNEASPPQVQLQVCWLAAQQLQALQQQLQQLWKEQGAGPVCFTWLDHIKTAALPALGINTELVLHAPAPPRHKRTTTAAAAAAAAAAAGEKPTSSGSSSSSVVIGVAAEDLQKLPKAATGAKLSAAAAPFDPFAAAMGSSVRQLPHKEQQHSANHHKVPKKQQRRQQQQHNSQPNKQQQSTRKQQQQLQNKQQEPKAHTDIQQQLIQQQQTQQHHQQQQAHLDTEQLGQQQDSSSSSSSGSVEQLAVQLLRYSAAREAEAFMAASQLCGICFEQVPGSACLRLPDCQHFYCSACLKAHADSQLQQGAVENMRCPEPSCRRAMPPYAIQELLGPEGYARWEELLLQRTLDKMEDVVYCPRCDAVCIEDADHCAQCSNCLYVFCSFCHDSWHPGSECLDPHERLRVLERRKGATGAGDRRHEMDLINQAMNLKYLTSCSRKCPSCGMATIKNEGCNKMTCVYCRANWCWKCQQVIQGYDHFRDSRCNMFDQEEIARWNAMMWANERAREVEMGQIMMQVRGNTPGARLCRCPVCGQENLREGRNNLMRCWSCNCHFCYACRTWLRAKVGQHFVGTGACKQHSD